MHPTLTMSESEKDIMRLLMLQQELILTIFAHQLDNIQDPVARVTGDVALELAQAHSRRITDKYQVLREE